MENASIIIKGRIEGIEGTSLCVTCVTMEILNDKRIPLKVIRRLFRDQCSYNRKQKEGVMKIVQKVSNVSTF